jgi:hypothetical protein
LTENKVLTSSTVTPIAGIQITSSREILHPNSRLCLLEWAPSGYGKTELAGGLDDLTQSTLGKRTLYIAVEEGEGGGAATLRSRDIPMCVPKDYKDLHRILGLLRNDKSYGGLVLDSASETARKFVKSEALKYPCRENTPTRATGVATRSDYQVMAELMSGLLRTCIGMTTHENPEYRKHLIVTAADVQREEDEKVVFIGPDLPGAMARAATQMFQQVFYLEIKPEVIGGKRVPIRYLVTSQDGVRAAKDRYKILPERIRVKSSQSDHEGENIQSLWEKYYVPNMQGEGR